ncbi:interleukin-1 receptor type 1 isoform X2 [Amia ocellicauda]
MQMIVSVVSDSCFHRDYFSTKELYHPTLIPCIGWRDVHLLDQQPQVKWFKDCAPFEKNGDATDPYDNKLYVRNMTIEDVGNYTCQINFTHMGENYTASSTTEISTNERMSPEKPFVLYPRNVTFEVERGSRQVFNCTVFIGFRKNAESETSIYWTINDTVIELFQGTHVEEKLTIKNEKNKGTSGQLLLIISEVTPALYNLPLKCIVTNPLGNDEGYVRMIQAHRRHFYSQLMVSIIPLIIAVVLIYYFFKADIVLLYRKLRFMTRTRTVVSDGKLYDAYVIFPRGHSFISNKAEDFAVQVLPAVLESRCGYKLFIMGRDDTPGEAMHSIIEESIKRSRRLIIILSSHVLEDQIPTAFEPQMGLYAALIACGIKVILIEMDKNIDYSLLPESVRYIRQKQGASRWVRHNKECQLSPNTRFWKSVRYQMPPEPGLVHT